jgi:hypothetical protein
VIAAASIERLQLGRHRAASTADGRTEGVALVTCYLLHIMEDPDRDAYRDPDLKDVVGHMPKFYCAHCQPLKQLLPSDATRCLERDAPCWKPADRICD